MASKKASEQKRWKWKSTSTGRVADTLREQIASGRFQIDEKLPTFDDLAVGFGVSRFTIQNAVNLLKKEGFIRGVQRGGLYVAKFPPHLHCFGLVHKLAPGKEDWPRFSALVAEVAPAVFKKAGGFRFKNYYDVNSSTKTEEWAALIEDVSRRRLAGVLTLLDGVEVFGDPFFLKATVPLLSLFASDLAVGMNPAVTMVTPSYDVFVQKALDKFKEHDRRRLAWLTIPPVRYSLNHFQNLGFQMKPHWLVHLARKPADLSYNITSLLLDRASSERPNALMLADENLVPGALRAMEKLKLKPGRDLEVVAHMNQPTISKDLHPGVHWLGYQVEETLAFTLRCFKAGEIGGHHRMEPKFLERLRVR